MFYSPHLRPPSNHSTSHIPPQPPYLHIDVPIPYSTWPLNSLGPPVSWGLGASSLNEQRPRSPLLYVCWRPHISCCMLSVWWSSVSEISGEQVNWDCWSSYRVALFLSFFQPSLIQQLTEVSCFCPLVECKYVHLTLLAACWVFRRAFGPS
jgi:hypothetical protein